MLCPSHRCVPRADLVHTSISLDLSTYRSQGYFAEMGGHPPRPPQRFGGGAGFERDFGARKHAGNFFASQLGCKLGNSGGDAFAFRQGLTKGEQEMTF
jgi:hypothetical protein